MPISGISINSVNTESTRTTGNSVQFDQNPSSEAPGSLVQEIDNQTQRTELNCQWQ